MRFLAMHVTPILIGLLFGGVAAFDFLIGRTLGLREIPMVQLGPGGNIGLAWIEVPHLFSGLFLLFVTALFLCLRLWGLRIKILLLLLILSPQIYSLTPANLDLANFIVPAFLYVTILDLFMGERLHVSPAFIPILALIGLMILSVVNGKLPAFVDLVREIKNLCFFFLIFLNLRDSHRLRFALKALIVVSAFSAVVGIFQEVAYLFTGVPVAIGFISEENMDDLLYHGSTFRVPGFFGTAGILGGTMAPVGAIVISLILSKGLGLFRRQWTLFLVLPPILTTLYLAYNRPAYAAFVLGAVLALYLARPSLSLHITAFLMLLPVTALLLSIASPRLFEDVSQEVKEEVYSGNLRDRLILNERALIGIFTKHPIVGAGVGQGRIYTQDFKRWPAHSAPIQAAADIGIPGALVYLSISLVAFVRLLPVIGRGNAEHRELAKVLLVGFVALFSHMFVEPFFLKYPLSWIHLGLMESLTVLSSRETAS